MLFRSVFTLVEPVYIGENCEIVNSTVGPNVTVMDGVKISDSHISESIVLWNATIKGQTVENQLVEEG